jgi:hypothetical protein
MAAYVPRALLASVVPVGGTAVLVAQGPLSGGYITNPAAATENLLVDMVGVPGLLPVGTTTALIAGQTFYIPPLNGNVFVRVNAATTAHAFNGEVW